MALGSCAAAGIRKVIVAGRDVLPETSIRCMIRTPGWSYSGQIHTFALFKVGVPCACAGWNVRTTPKSNSRVKIRRMLVLLKENEWANLTMK
jgi:hypothetical protein